jgi:hypothetical protein
LAQWRAAATNSTPRTPGKIGLVSRAREDKDMIFQREKIYKTFIKTFVKTEKDFLLKYRLTSA